MHTHRSSKNIAQQTSRSSQKRAGVTFSLAPHKLTWYVPLLQPLLLFSNAIFAAWNFWCFRTVRVQWISAPENLLMCAESTGRPIIYYSWHAYSWLVLNVFQNLPRALMPTIIGHDGLLSRMNQRSYAWFGFAVWVYRRKSPIRPKQQIIDMIAIDKCNIALAADSGGPYGKVKPGLMEIARATNALLVPIVIRGRGIIQFNQPLRHFVALPFCSLAVYTTAPLYGEATSTSECQRALDELEKEAVHSHRDDQI